jgi:hypothetical protein
MANRPTLGVLLSLVTTVGLATGCTTTEGRPTVAQSSSAASSQTRSATSSSEPSETSSPTPTGQPITTAAMKISGGAGPVTIRYQVNGAPEQTETNVTLPWEKQYPVYDEIPSSVTADGGDTELICTIIMDGNLVSFKTEPRPTCSFAYYG